MTKEVTIKKHNSLTDGRTTYSLTAEKLLNAVYHTWEREGVDTFTVPIADLKELIGMDGNDNEYLYDCLKELQTVQRFRNFDYKGRGIKLLQSSFIMDLTVYKDNQNYAQMTINPKIIEALKQRAGYTPLELKIVEKFRTVGGYKLFQLFKRYGFLPNSTDSKIGSITFTLEEMNNVLGTKYTYLSDIEKVIKRGLNEIHKIADIEISVMGKKKEKEFAFAWGRKSPYLQTIATFMEHMRKYYKQEVVYSTDTRKIAINEDGLLYDKARENQPFLTQKEATKTWQSMYKFALEDKLFILKQGKLF